MVAVKSEDATQKQRKGTTREMRSTPEARFNPVMFTILVSCFAVASKLFFCSGDHEAYFWPLEGRCGEHFIIARMGFRVRRKRWGGVKKAGSVSRSAGGMALREGP